MNTLNKKQSIYMDIRKELKISRDKACQLTGDFITPDRLEKIENGKVQTILPEEVIALSEAYGKPELCNYYCINQCAIGERYVREIKVKDLAHIAIDTLSSLNRINSQKDRLLEIVEDEEISPDEYEDFMHIKQYLDKIAATADSLKYWIDNASNTGKLQKK